MLAVMRFCHILLLATLVLTACYDSSFDHPSERPAPPRTLLIKDLHAMYRHSGTIADEDLVVHGTVTSSDQERNFYRTLVIEDEGWALEIMAGVDHLHNDFPEGCRVALRLGGLAVGKSRGVLQVGAQPLAGSVYPTDFLHSKADLDQHLTRLDLSLQPIEPRFLSITQLHPSLCGTLVEIPNIQLATSDDQPATWEGTHRFKDARGNEIATYVRPYARFADEEIPRGKCSLSGILQSDAEGYSLKLRTRDDCR